ncbi:hypothetical protein FB45DRAFT_895663 [Roridomyces roridus]|uniref:Uncharacterized protein n=1 Tax=Roridomyces roridus TaxID=1738132 RepID=A0AAD7FWQ4_9AGAR|nr:hypothetical protein FB45DRAFT_895663 [Roridomyces roridus]
MISPRDAPTKWVVLNIPAIQRASDLLRRRLSYLGSARLRSARKLRGADGGPQDIYWFEVEDVMFKVHASLLRLEIGAPLADSVSRRNALNARVLLSETADNFSHFLWDLQAYPYELSQIGIRITDVSVVIDRALRVAETAVKHNIPILQLRIIHSLRQFVLSSRFRSASSQQHCRLLHIATHTTCGGDLLRVLSRRLTSVILRRRESPPDPTLISLVSSSRDDPHLRRIHGAICYRQLIDMEKHPLGTMDVASRTLFLRAHSSLFALTSRICTSAPPLPTSISDDCGESHSECERAWSDIWLRAAAVAATPSSMPMQAIGSADVLGKLQAMRGPLERLVAEDPIMSIECALAALECVVELREVIVEGLMNHFV